MARPRKQVDVNLIEGLARIGCTDEEIAIITEVSSDTLVRRFAERIKRGRAEMKMSLRRIQMRLAEEGNATMAIWLGKQNLSQTDRQEINATVTHKEFEVDIGGFISSTQTEQDEHIN